MTQVVRQKWVLAVAGVNALLALAVVLVVSLGLAGVERGGQEASLRREAELREVRAELERLHGLPAALEGLRTELRDELRDDGLRRAAVPAPADPQLTQTLQLVASEQQLLLLRAMQPAPRAVSRRSGRRPRRPRQAGCALTR